MDIVKKNGDHINTEELSRQLGCKIVEISALKGTGIQEAAEAAIDVAKNVRTVPMHTFSGVVEHALAQYEEAAEQYGDTDLIIDAFASEYGTEEIVQALDAEAETYEDETAKAALAQLIALTPSEASLSYEVEDEETLEVTEVPGVTREDLQAPVFRRAAGTVIQHLLQQRFYIKEEWLAFGRPFFFF